MLGTNKFRKDPLYKHEKSTCHIACVNHQCYLDSKGKLGSATSTAIGRGILALHEKHRKRLMILFNTAYGLAKKNRPFIDFPTVCSIQEKNGLVGLLGEIYITDKAAKHFTSSIAKTMLDVYRGLISNPPSQLTHILVLIELMLTMSSSTAHCERGFSGN